MSRLSTLDLCIVGVYVAGMTLFGVWFTNKQKDLRAYFVGGRDVGWLMVLLSIVATETSAVTFLSVPGLGYKPDGGKFLFLQLALGYILGRCIVAWFLLPQYMRGDLFSAYEVLRTRFDTTVQRVASGLFLLTRTIADGLRIYLTALLLQYIGWGVEASILVVGVVTVVYTYLGGMKAVLWTDVIQFAVKIAGAAFAAYYVVRLLPGGWDAYIEQGQALGRFRWLDPEFTVSGPLNVWTAVVGGAVLSMASHGADQLMVQRYLCARSLGHARAALVLSGFVVFAQFVLFLGLGVGLYLLARAGEFPEATPDRRPDEVFGLFIVTRLPSGVVGVLVAAVLAAAMSTLSSSLNSSANAFVTDFYRPLRPGRPEREYVSLSRGMTAAWGVAQMGVAYLAFLSGEAQSVVEQVLKVAGFTTGLLLGLFVLGSLRRPVSSRAALVGLVAGAAAVTLAWLPSAVPGGRFGTITVPAVAWPWYAPVGAGTTVAVGLLANTLGHPRRWPPTR